MAEEPSTVKSYDGARVSVSFDAARCLHYAECVRGAPTVFDTAARPWINPDGADVDLIAEVVRRCPSGALQYRVSDGPDEDGDENTTVRRTPDGRIAVRGQIDIEVTDSDGTVRTSRETRFIACGCGRSARGLFCDGTCTS